VQPEHALNRGHPQFIDDCFNHFGYAMHSVTRRKCSFP
jgi:hypothetical protein